MTLMLLLGVITAFIIGLLPSEWVMRKLLQPPEYSEDGKTIVYWLPLIKSVALVLDLAKGLVVIPLAYDYFQNELLVTLVVVAMLCGVALSPIKPQINEIIPTIGIMVLIDYSIAITVGVFFIIFLFTFRRYWASLFLALYIYPLLIWSFRVESNYPLLALIIALIFSLKYLNQLQNEIVRV